MGMIPWILVLGLTLRLAPTQKIHLEAEDAMRVETTVSTHRRGYSGSGYVVGFDHEGARIEFPVQAKAGLYEVRIRYSSPFGEKGYILAVNKERFSGMFARTGDVFSTCNAGKVELTEGPNTVAIERGWGYYDIDYIDLIPTSVDSPLRKPPKTLVDHRASPGAQVLMDYLVSLYGFKTLSGQYEPSDSAYVRAQTGKSPAILGGDFMDYSPSRLPFGSMPNDLTEQMIKSAQEGSVITMVWHWNAPDGLLNKTYVDERGNTIDAMWYKGFYTNATTFDVERALDSPDSEAYRLLLRDIDAIAVQLKKFADAGIPVLWRPLHEAEGKWFWWGAKGPEPFIRLWRLMFDRLTQTHGLHNLIWVYTGTDPAWYPGNAYVDVVGIDAYPSDPGDPLSSEWEALKRRFDGKKLLALTEFGGVPDVPKMRRFGVRWAYFVSWSGTPQNAPSGALTRGYHSDAVVNRDALETHR